MLLEIIHCRLLNTSYSVMKTMFHHQIITGLPKHCPKKINKAPCTICYTLKITIYPKGKTIHTTNLLQRELIHM